MTAIHGVSDSNGPDMAEILRVFRDYVDEHPRAEVSVFRRTGIGTLGVRVIDPDFEGMPWKARNDGIWNLLDDTADGAVDSVSVLLLLTPREAAESHLSSVEFDGLTDGPVRFVNDSQVFRENVAGRSVFVTVGRPVHADSGRTERFDVSFKFDFPPGIIAADDDGLSVDAGETLRDADHAPRQFESVEAARVAALEAVQGRLARLAAA